MTNAPLTQDFELIVVASATPLHVQGRAARLILQIAQHAERINALAVGQLIAHLAHGQVKLELRESLPAAKLDSE